MSTYTKKSFPLSKIRRFLEPGPTILISSRYNGETDIMANGWHTMMSFAPAIVACYIWDQNRSHELIRKSGQCVINIPEFGLLDTVIGIGNLHGPADKFSEFGLTPTKGSKVDAPLIEECYANFECELTDTKLIRNYSLFLFEVVKAHVATKPEYPKTVHYRGDGVFMTAGPSVSRKAKFKKVNL